MKVTGNLTKFENNLQDQTRIINKSITEVKDQLDSKLENVKEDVIRSGTVANICVALAISK